MLHKVKKTKQNKIPKWNASQQVQLCKSTVTQLMYPGIGWEAMGLQVESCAQDCSVFVRFGAQAEGTAATSKALFVTSHWSGKGQVKLCKAIESFCLQHVC